MLLDPDPLILTPKSFTIALLEEDRRKDRY